ncbi:MAG: leucine-rich repeat domain-containing protein [Oscillospiraceae bacterium]|nr:leucine-rich repeat domain-containing protein [Oscillospiraceae bacterium]
MNKFCGNCGTALEKNSKFCGECGTNIETAENSVIENKPNLKSKKNIYAISAVCLVIICVVIGLVYNLRNTAYNEPYESAAGQRRGITDDLLELETEQTPLTQNITENNYIYSGAETSPELIKDNIITIIYEADGVVPSATEFAAVIEIIRSRLYLLNYNEATVNSGGNNQIIVEIPGASDPESIVEMLGMSAVLEFRDAYGNVVLDGNDIADASTMFGDAGKGYSEYFISLRLRPAAVSKFAAATRDAAARAATGKNYISIYLDETEISAPRVSEEINSDSAIITGEYDKANADYMSEIITAGQIPFALRVVEIKSTNENIEKDMVFINTLSEALDKLPENITKEELARVKVLYIDGNYYPEWGYIAKGFSLRLGYNDAAQSLKNSMENEDFTDDDFENRFVQVFSEADIKDFSYLAYFPNLEFIRLYYQPNLRDISFFENMNSLIEVNLQFIANVQDFSPLGGLTSMQSLTVTNSNLQNTDVFKNLMNLKTLSLNNNLIEDITPLQNLSKLKKLYLNSNKINDVSVLTNFTSLETLYLNGNNIENAAVLSRLTNLTELNISETEVKNLSDIAGLTKLELLAAEKLQIENISPIASLKSLETLLLSGNGISDLTPLSGLTSLENLILNENYITDISPLEPLGGSMKNLSLAYNEISDVSILAAFELLETLYLDNNKIEDFLPLSALEELGMVQISGYETQYGGGEYEWDWDEWDWDAFEFEDEDEF